MNTIQKDQIEKLNCVITKAIKTAEETVKTIVNSNTQQLSDSIDSNHKFLELMKARFLLNGLDPNIISTIKSFYNKGSNLSEQVISTLISAHSRRSDDWKEHTLKLVELLQDQQFLSEVEKEKIVNRIIENFEFVSEKSQHDLLEIAGLFNLHKAIAMNFNQRLAEPLKKQLESIGRLKGPRMPVFNKPASQWWKGQSMETEVLLNK